MKPFISLILAFSVCGSAAAQYHHDTPVQMKMRRNKSDHPQTEMPSDANFKLGQQRFEEGDYDGAIDAFLQSVYYSRNEYQPQGYFWLGKSYMAKHDKHEDPKALEAFKKAAEQSVEKMPDADLLRGEIFLRDGDIEQAEKEANQCIIDSEGPAYKAQNLYGLICEAREEYGTAESHFQAALGEPPYTFTVAWINLAECQMKEKNWAEAVKNLRAMLVNQKKLVSIDAHYPRIYLDIGICLLAKGDHQGAIDNWHTSLDFEKDYSEPHLQLAMLLDAENHMSTAVHEYKEFIRTSTDRVRVAKAKERVAMLEQKMAPAEVEPQQERPSMYMRQQSEQRQHEEQKQQQQMQNRDSGF